MPGFATSITCRMPTCRGSTAAPRLYSGAIATLYPSLYEGFGLPPLEAVACGSAAICSRGTLAVREVMGAAATYCEAHDIDGWRTAMETLLDTPRTRSNHASRFTWRRTAEQTLAVYDPALQVRRLAA
jgi:glycosyltransferase involved in cell wall biosynthesis